MSNLAHKERSFGGVTFLSCLAQIEPERRGLQGGLLIGPQGDPATDPFLKELKNIDKVRAVQPEIKTKAEAAAKQNGERLVLSGPLVSTPVVIDHRTHKPVRTISLPTDALDFYPSLEHALFQDDPRYKVIPPEWALNSIESARATVERLNQNSDTRKVIMEFAVLSQFQKMFRKTAIETRPTSLEGMLRLFDEMNKDLGLPVLIISPGGSTHLATDDEVAELSATIAAMRLLFAEKTKPRLDPRLPANENISARAG